VHVDKLGKVVWTYPIDAGVTHACPECGVPYLSNSTGPASMPLATRLLHGLWSEKYLGGFPPHVHDYASLLCPAGWTVVGVLDTVTVVCKTQEQAARGYLKMMLLRVNRLTEPGVKRDILRGLAYRNYQAVRLLGNSSFKHTH